MPAYESPGEAGEIEEKDPVEAMRAGDILNWEDTIPCPTCWLPADLVAPPAYDTNPHSLCPRGHDNSLIPAVLAHLRSLQAQAVERLA